MDVVGRPPLEQPAGGGVVTVDWWCWREWSGRGEVLGLGGGVSG
jgi:hypothetical protein